MWGASFRFETPDSDQHAFEARRTSMKLIVLLHLRAALFYWGNNLSACVQGRKERQRGLWTFSQRFCDVFSCCGIWLTHLFLTHIQTECLNGGLIQHQSELSKFQTPYILSRFLHRKRQLLYWPTDFVVGNRINLKCLTPWGFASFLFLPLPRLLLSIHPLPFPPPWVVFALITNMALGESMPLHIKSWSCKTLLFLNMLRKPPGNFKGESLN